MMNESPKLQKGAFSDPGAALVRRVRMRKEDSAWVYTVFESHEGILSYTTLDHQPGDLYRDLEISVPVTMAQEAQRMLGSLGDLIYEISSDRPHA